ncbi:MAG: hypothetical protein FWC40_03880, partial [Proteobacteria bacterium]|nr:hypothetical protein [Pseudomonadota bacterium]
MSVKIFCLWGPRPLRRYRTRLIAASKWCRYQEARRRGRERTSYVTDHNDAADDEEAHYCTSQERGAQMAQILGSKEAWKGAYS